MGEERWMLHTKRADFERIGKQFSVSPVVARIIRNRDVESDEDIRKYLFGGLSDLYSPHRTFALAYSGVKCMGTKI